MFSLVRKDSRLFLVRDDGTDPIEVTLAWARPISGRGGEVSLIGPDKKEVLFLNSLAELDGESRRVAEEELARRYLVSRIVRVYATEARFGDRYWDVETERGRRRFVMKDPNANIIWAGDDSLIIRDTLGNRYTIESLEALDPASRAQVLKVV